MLWIKVQLQYHFGIAILLIRFKNAFLVDAPTLTASRNAKPKLVGIDLFDWEKIFCTGADDLIFLRSNFCALFGVSAL